MITRTNWFEAVCAYTHTHKHTYGFFSLPLLSTRFTFAPVQSHSFCIISSYLWVHLIDVVWCDNICNWTNSVYVLHVVRIPVAKRCSCICLLLLLNELMIDVWSASSCNRIACDAYAVSINWRESNKRIRSKKTRAVNVLRHLFLRHESLICHHHQLFLLSSFGFNIHTKM